MRLHQNWSLKRLMVKHVVFLTAFSLSGSRWGYTYRQGTPMEEPPVHCRAICGFGALFKGSLSSALKECLDLPLWPEGLRRPLRGPSVKKSTCKVSASQFLPGTPTVESRPLIQHNTSIFTFPHLYTEWSIMLCERGHMDRWFHHPLLKGVNAGNICWGNQYAPPSSLCNIAPFDWHSTLKGRWKNNWSKTSDEQTMFERGLGALLTPWYCDYSPKVGRHGGEQLYNHPIINNTDPPSMRSFSSQLQCLQRFV